MNQLPIFESIEQLFPLWKTARPIVENTLPRALRFEMTGKDTLGVSLDWAQAIVDLAPPEDVQAVHERINTAWGHASAAIDMQPLSVLYRKPATQENLHRADSILEHQVQGMLAAGKPTPIQILSHLMGITPLYAMVKIKGTDAITEPAREEFEALCLALAPKHYRHANCETALRTLFERRTDGTYSIDWVDGAWIGYQAGREPVVIVLPLPLEDDLTLIAAIEAAGATVKVKP